MFAVLCLPFVFKPLHVDDPLYVWVARQITRHPADYFGFRVNWEGHVQPFSEFFQNPPLPSYCLAGIAALFGWSEVALHLGFQVFNIASLIGVFCLAGRFCSRPMLVTLMVMLSPAFFVPATTLMCEPPLVCFWIWAVYLWVRGSPGSIVGAGVCVVAASLSKYVALSLFPLLIAHAVLFRASGRARIAQAISLVGAAAVFAGYEMYSAHLYGIGAVANAIGYSHRANAQASVPVMVRLAGTLAFVGGGAVSASLLAFVALRRRVSLIALAAAVVLAVVASGCLAPPPGWLGTSTGPAAVQTVSWTDGFAYFIQFALMLAGGGMIIVCGLKSFRTSIPAGDWRADLFLLLWAGGIFVFTCFLNWSINARSILPMVVPVSLLVARQLDHRRPAVSTRWIAGWLGVAGGITVLVAAADFHLAETSRSAVQILIDGARTAPPASDGWRPRLWFVGHWGFQYYMEAAGATEVDDQSPRFQPGDLVIAPANSYGANPVGHHFQTLGRVQVGPPRFVSTMSTAMGAGFYSSHGQAIPFVFGPAPPESFSVLRVTPESTVSHD